MGNGSGVTIVGTHTYGDILANTEGVSIMPVTIEAGQGVLTKGTILSFNKAKTKVVKWGSPAVANLAVTFNIANDKVIRNAHGLQNGNKVYFTSITTTTGIVTNAIYFVVNRTDDDFQVSHTVGGAPIDLATNNGTGVMTIPADNDYNDIVGILADDADNATTVDAKAVAYVKGEFLTNKLIAGMGATLVDGVYKNGQFIFRSEGN